MEKAQLLEVRKNQKAKKPEFIRRDGHKKARLEMKWHRPKGLHNKMRLHKGGKPACVSSGYGSPKLVKGLASNGMQPVVVASLTSLSLINAKEQLAVLSSGLGQKKRTQLLEKAKELGITVRGTKQKIKSVDEYLEYVKSDIKARQDKRQAKSSAKEKRAKDAEKKAKEKEAKAVKSEEKKLTPEEQLAQEKKLEQEKNKEKNKILTQKA